jgi:hypothetical protein
MVPRKRTGQLQKQELHARGIVLVARRLLRQGFVIRSLAQDMDLDPQIVASRAGRDFHFAVRTARWPRTGELECEELRDELLNWAVRHEAACYLASVSVKTDSDGYSCREKVRFIKLT